MKAVQNTGMNTELKNDTSTVGYAGLQLMKGKVIVIDNALEGTQNMVVKEKYVIAHTHDLYLQTFNPASPIPQARLQAQRDANGDRGAGEVLGGDNNNMDFGGVAGGHHSMSQVVSVRDDPKRLEGFEKKMIKIFSDQSQISQLY